MAPDNGTRRSTRLAEKTKAKADPKPHARTPIAKKRTSPRKSAQKKKASLVDLDQIEEQLAARKTKPLIPRTTTTAEQPRRPIPHFDESMSEDSATDIDTDSDDEFSMEHDSEESEDEFHEQANLSHDHIEYVNSHDLRITPGHRYSTQSYDSRLEPGNEQYEMDNFVVDDDESVLMENSEASDDESDGDLDLEINMKRDPVQAGYQTTGRAVRSDSIFSDVGSRRRSSTATSRKINRPSRQASQASYGSRRSSSLFVSDLVGDPSIPLQLAPWLHPGGKGVETPLIAQASAEVVEEIVDALALFSRRVNRNRPPVRLRLAAAVLEDEEIRDALEAAIRTGLGRKLSLDDGSKRWSFGPKGR